MILALALLTPVHCVGTVERVRPSPLLAFRASLPCGVARNRPLARALRWRMERDRQRAAREAWRARRHARHENHPYARHSLAYDWTVEGATAQLISLSAEVTRYEGGGHAEDQADVVLWDVARGRTLRLRVLFDAAALQRLGARFCRSWARERPCPPLATAAPADSDGNGRFDTLRVIHTSSLYDEGRQSFDVRFAPEDLARIPAAYRPSFEVR